MYKNNVLNTFINPYTPYMLFIEINQFEKGL